MCEFWIKCGFLPQCENQTFKSYVNSLQQNQRLDQYKSKMTEESTKILKEWLWADYQIYNTFNSHLTERLKDYGHNRLINDLAHLNELNAKLKKDCQVRQVDNTRLMGTDLHMGSHMVHAYNLTQKCRLYATSEPSFFNIIRTSQEERAKPLLYNKFFILRFGK